MAQPQCVANDRYRAQRHRRTGNHRAEQQPAHWIQHASGNRDSDGVIDEREEEVLPDVPHSAPAEAPGPGNATQVPFDEGHAGALHGHIRASAHGNPDLCLGQGWRVVDAIPRHRHHVAIRLQALNYLSLLLWEYLSLNALDTEPARYGFCRGPAIPSEHDNLDTVRP